MIVLSPYSARVIQRINFIGTWTAVVVCCRNFMICYAQYKRSKGKIHLMNMAQVTVIFLHRILYGIIPLFEITTCAYFPLLVSLWHLAYILFYVVMFQRLIILEADHHSKYIKVIGLLLIAVRFADWPYELTVHELYKTSAMDTQSIFAGGTCWAQWQVGVLILNFIGDAIANLFLSGMFVRRLYKHIRSTQSSTPQNQMIEYIARKSLICLALTFFVNLAMNLLKVTGFIGEYSDAFTVFFELAESTLLVEALRVDDQLKATVGCSHCGRSSGNVEGHHRHDPPPSQKRSRLPTFGSFDFVPLEERHSAGDPFKYNNNNSNNSNQNRYDQHTTTSSYSTTTTTSAAAKRVTYDDDHNKKDEYDGGASRQYSMDTYSTSKRSPPSVSAINIKSSMDITNNYQRPVSPQHEPAFPTNSFAPSPTASSVSAHYQAPNVTRPLDTLSRSLAHNPEWNNNDYRMF